MKRAKIYILLLNCNHKEETLRCLGSLRCVSFPRFWPLIIDNNSTDGSIDAIRTVYSEIPILALDKNLGEAEAMNQGIKWALLKGAEWICLLTSDTVVAPDFLDGFMTAKKSVPNASILGAKIYREWGSLQIDHLGGFWDPKKGDFISFVKDALD